MNINPVSHLVSATRDLANHATVTAEVGWTLLAGLVVIAIFAPLVGAQLPAAHVASREPLDELARLVEQLARAAVAVAGSRSAAIRPGARASACGAIRSHAIVGIVRL